MYVFFVIEAAYGCLLSSFPGPGWRAEVRPSNHPVSEFDFDVVIGADGRKNTLDGNLAKLTQSRVENDEYCCSG